MSTAADAVIVIFGAAVLADGQPSRTLRQRVEAAARFGAGFRTPLFIPTGGIGRHGPSEAEVMARLLRETGDPTWLIWLEETATDTVSSVFAVKALLRQSDQRGPVFVATSAYHMPRCLLLMWLAGIPVRICPPPRAPASTRFTRRWYWRLREIPAIPYDAAVVLARRVCGV